MNPVEIEEAVTKLATECFDPGEFPFKFLAAFGNKKTTIDRLKKGSTNQSDVVGGLLQRNNIHIAVCKPDNVAATLSALRESPKTISHRAKFVLATDGREFLAEDLSSGETLACEFDDFPEHFGFFLPLAGITTVKQIRESSFDIRATSRLNRLYLTLLQENPDWATPDRRADMNHFMARLIFCFFAEDTDIFHPDHRFTDTVDKMSAGGANNTAQVIQELFRAMNTPHAKRSEEGVPRWANGFPYVNGNLFSGNHEVPLFSKIARSYLLNIGNLDWTKINPDIFGSMIQAVADEEERGALGMHYTSVPNILKVLNPLFLDGLREKLEEAGDNPRKLLNLRARLASIRLFDPACGSGNFLVIAYKELRAIEAEINRRRGEAGDRTKIALTNFRGIELREFPAEIARLALIIAEYQCDVLYRGQKEALAEFLPLDSQNWITCGNSLRMDWLRLMAFDGRRVRLTATDLFSSPLEQPEINFEAETLEIYLCGNPPFAGQKNKSAEQRADMAFVMPRYTTNYGELDYVSAFYVKAAEFVAKTGFGAALVSTNSVSQGRHVPNLWPAIEKLGVRIQFAYRSFAWQNNASANASVYCVIVGLSANSEAPKYIFEGSDRKAARHINGYLADAPSIVVQKRKTPLGRDLQMMRSGNMPLDNGNLLLSAEEAEGLVRDFPAAAKFLKRAVGAKEINQGLMRYCLWIASEDLSTAMAIEPVRKRIEACAAFRANSSAPELSKRPHEFRDTHLQRKSAIILPNLSSEKRRYRVPILVGDDVVPTNLALAIYDGAIFQYGVLASRLHHVWVEAVCGKLKMDYRYSNDLGWHTFPLPNLTAQQKSDLEQSSVEILLAQEAEFPASLNDLYNGENGEIANERLRKAHERNDEVLERIFIGRLFANDTERLDTLFSNYLRMTTSV